MAQVALVGNDQGRASVVERLAFVELPHDAASILDMRLPAHDMQRARAPSILLEGAGQRVVLRIGLELLDEQ